MKNSIVALLFMLISGVAVAQGGAPVAGRDYIEIPDGSPLDSAEGKIVVEEFFNYICPACYSFEPRFLAWQETLPDDVVVHHVPATFRGDFNFYAGVYYAAKALGVEEETHAKIYEAIHARRILPGEGQAMDENKVAAFYSDFGVSSEDFLKTLHSFGVDSQLRRATNKMTANKIPGTPTLVINGRYMVQSNSYQGMFDTANYLINRVRQGQ